MTRPPSLVDNQGSAESQELTSEMSNVTLRRLLNALARRSTVWLTSVFGNSLKTAIIQSTSVPLSAVATSPPEKRKGRVIGVVDAG
jgi:hypothetical protein